METKNTIKNPLKIPEVVTLRAVPFAVRGLPGVFYFERRGSMDKRIFDVEEPLRRCVNRLKGLHMPMLAAPSTWHGIEVPPDYLQGAGEIIGEVLDDLETAQQTLGLKKN